MATKRKFTGKQLVDFASSFFSDFRLANMMYGVLIRSPLPRGKIRSISHPQLPENYFLYTAKDIPGEKTVSLLGTEIPILAQEEVAYQGEPLAILVGPDKARVLQLSKEVIIRFHRSLEGGSNLDSMENQNIIAQRTIGEGNDAELLFAEADIQVEGSYSSNCYAPHCGEATGGFALYQDNRLILYAPVQWFSQVRRSIATGLGISPDQVEIRKTLVAGGTNKSQWYFAILSAQLAVAAYLCGKPVKMVFSREEQCLYFERPTPVVVSYRSAVSPEGKILAMIVSIVLDTGIYNPFIQELMNRMIVAAVGVYNPAVYKIEAYAIQSQTPPTAFTLQRMDSQIFFALESHLSEIARKVGKMPHEVRLLNHQSQPLKPFKFNFTHLEKVLKAVIDKSSFQRKYWAYNLAQKDSCQQKLTSPVPIRGIGISCGFEGSGFLGSSRYIQDLTMELTLEKDGTVVIHSYPPSAWIQSIWIKIVAKELDVEEKNISINGNFSVDSEPLYPAGFFGNIGLMTQLLRKACTAIQKKRFQQPLPIHVSRGLTSTQKKQWNSESFSGSPFFSTATGSAVVEVELDTFTYKTFIRGIWVAVEGGEILSPERAIATIKAAIRESIQEFVAWEEIEVQNIFVELLPGSKEPKQLGTLVYSLVPSALATALSQACNQSISAIPLQSNFIYQSFFPQLPDKMAVPQSQPQETSQGEILEEGKQKQEESE